MLVVGVPGSNSRINVFDRASQTFDPSTRRPLLHAEPILSDLLTGLDSHNQAFDLDLHSPLPHRSDWAGCDVTPGPCLKPAASCGPHEVDPAADPSGKSSSDSPAHQTVDLL